MSKCVATTPLLLLLSVAFIALLRPAYHPSASTPTYDAVSFSPDSSNNGSSQQQRSLLSQSHASSSSTTDRNTRKSQTRPTGARRNHQRQEPPQSSSHLKRKQRQRRAMDNDNTQRNSYQQGHNDKLYRYPDERRQKRKAAPSTQLSDVWLCLCFALGWSTWFLSAFLNTDLMRFAKQNGSVMTVHGNVREVSIEECEMGTGIPSYSALIDYIVTVRGRSEAGASISTIQVRKQFLTQHLLQQGFANVELLVLPEEPTSSVLKEEWQREVKARDQAEEDLDSLGGIAGELGELGAAVVGGTGLSYGDALPDKAREGSGSIRAISSGSVEQHRFDILTRRASLIFSAFLVAMSLIGAVMAVHHMPSKKLQMWGWISLVVGAVFLWPSAMLALKISNLCQRLGRLPTEKSGIILSCNTNAQEGATLNDEACYKAHDEVTRDKSKGIGVNNADVMRTLGSKDNGCDQPQQQHARNQSNGALDTSMDDAECYFVKLPSGKQQRRGESELLKVDDLSVSTISANSSQHP